MRSIPCLSLTLLFLSASAQSADPKTVTSLLELRREHVVVQEWDLSCGAAALTTLLRHHFGDQITEKDVALSLVQRREYLENPELIQLREGFSLLDLKRLVDGRGYKGIGLGKLTLEELERRTPVLVPINTRGYNHFVVFRGRLGNRVLLADPAWGNRTMTIGQFDEAWIDYPGLGRVGFVVEVGATGLPTLDSLAPRPEEFVTFN